jgi:CRP-like cAMP-binding protein
MTADIRATIASQGFARDLPPDDIDFLTEVASTALWVPGETVFREGSLGDFLYLVVEGSVAIEVAVPQRGRVRIATIGPGELFGWSSLFYEKPKTALAAVLQPTWALAFDAARLRAKCDNDVGFGFRVTRILLNVVSDRLKATRGQLIDMFAR